MSILLLALVLFAVIYSVLLAVIRFGVSLQANRGRKEYLND
jgi:hypothetical protein